MGQESVPVNGEKMFCVLFAGSAPVFPLTSNTGADEIKDWPLDFTSRRLERDFP